MTHSAKKEDSMVEALLMPIRFGKDEGKLKITIAPWLVPVLISLVFGVGGFVLGNQHSHDQFRSMIESLNVRVGNVEREQNEAKERLAANKSEFVTRLEFEATIKRIDDNLMYLRNSLERPRH